MCVRSPLMVATQIVLDAGGCHANSRLGTNSDRPSDVMMRNRLKRSASSSSSNWWISISSLNVNPHRPRRSRDDAGGVVFVEGVQILALLLGDGLALGHRDLPDLVLVRLAAALLGLDRVLAQDAR